MFDETIAKISSWWYTIIRTSVWVCSRCDQHRRCAVEVRTSVLRKIYFDNRQIKRLYVTLARRLINPFSSNEIRYSLEV